jgi:hypothetical protein
MAGRVESLLRVLISSVVESFLTLLRDPYALA